MFSMLPLYLWGLDPLNSPLILKPIFIYANNDTARYGLNVPYNLSWTPHHLGHWPSKIILYTMYTQVTELSELIRQHVCMKWKLTYKYSSTVCDIPPNKQEQMPIEETGNMVWIIIIIMYDSSNHYYFGQLIMLAYITKRRQDFLDYLEPYWWEVKCTV